MMSKAEWNKNTEVKKGTYGENLVKKYFEDKDFHVYETNTDGKHGFDFIIDSMRGLMLFVDVKAIALRNVRPDTGITYTKYESYKKYATERNMDFLLVFVDEEEKRIYGNTIKELDKKEHLIQDGIIYWLVADMKSFRDLTEEEVKVLLGYVSRVTKLDPKNYRELYNKVNVPTRPYEPKVYDCAREGVRYEPTTEG